MILGLENIDVPIILSLILTKFSVGFITGIVVPIFPTLVATDFNESLNIWSDLNVTAFERTNLTFNYQKLSILFAMKNFCQIFISPIMGYLCGVLGSTKILLLGTVLSTSTLTLYGLGNKYYIFILGRIAESLSNSSSHCAVAAFIAYHYKDNKKRGFVYGITGLSLAIGTSLGPAYGGLIFQYYGKVVTFFTVLPFNILQIILVIWLLIYFQLEENYHSKNLRRSQILELEPKIIPPDITSPDVSKPQDILLTTEPTIDTSEIYDKDNNISFRQLNNEERIRTSFDVSITKEKHTILHFFKDPYFMILIGAYFIIIMSLFGYMATVSRYMRLTFGSTESQQGLIWILAIVGYVFGFFVGNSINHKLSKYRHIVLMTVIYLHALGSIFMALVPTWWSLAIPLCFIVNQEMIFEIVFSPLIAKIVEIRHQSKFGLMSGIIWTSISLVCTLSLYLGPILFSKIGFLYLNVILLLLGLVYGPLLLLLKKFV